MGRKIVGTRLQGKHFMAIAALARGDKPSEVAKQCRVDVGTIYAWQKWPLFQDYLENYIQSVAREALDRGIPDAIVDMHEAIGPIVKWMQQVILGDVELKDKARWKMALDYLHHAGILDAQQVAKAQANPASAGSVLIDQRQQILAPGNAELEARLKNFVPPRQIASP